MVGVGAWGGGGGWHVAMVCSCLAVPIGRSGCPSRGPFPSMGSGAHRPLPPCVLPLPPCPIFPSLLPFPSIGGGTHQPLTTLCPSSWGGGGGGGVKIEKLILGTGTGTVVGGRGQNRKKTHWEIILILTPKMMILQGVKHLISPMGVCYANDLKRGGIWHPRLCLI